jgi:hypothetical protein
VLSEVEVLVLSEVEVLVLSEVGLKKQKAKAIFDEIAEKVKEFEKRG